MLVDANIVVINININVILNYNDAVINDATLKCFVVSFSKLYVCVKAFLITFQMYSG